MIVSYRIRKIIFFITSCLILCFGSSTLQANIEKFVPHRLENIDITPGDFKIDFAAVDPAVFPPSPLTGSGDFFDGTGTDISVESLVNKSNLYACGDIVSYLLKIEHDGTSMDDPQNLQANFRFECVSSTGNPGAGYSEIVGMSLNTGDPGYVDPNTSVTLNPFSQTLCGTLFMSGCNLKAMVKLEGLEVGDVIIVRVDARIACDPLTNATGTFQAVLEDVEVVENPNGILGLIPGSANMTIPLKAGDLRPSPSCNLEIECSSNKEIVATANCEAEVDLSGLFSATSDCGLMNENLSFVNDGDPLTVISLDLNDITNVVFPAGINAVTYTATDLSGQVKSCSFNIMITGLQIDFVFENDLDATNIGTELCNCQEQCIIATIVDCENNLKAGVALELLVIDKSDNTVIINEDFGPTNLNGVAETCFTLPFELTSDLVTDVIIKAK